MAQHLIIVPGAMLTMAALLAAMVWMGITTAGTAEPFDADPAVIAMGIPSHRAPHPTR